MVFLSPPNSNGLLLSTFQARTNPPLTRALADCMDPSVLEQLRSRQPRRTTSMPTTPPTSQAAIATQISLRGIYSNLRRRRGAGVTGGRNEYLKALAISHDDPRADRAIAEHERFALRAYGRTRGTCPLGSS